MSEEKKRVQFPLVKSMQSPSLALTPEQVAEILEAEDIEAYREQQHSRIQVPEVDADEDN